MVRGRKTGPQPGRRIEYRYQFGQLTRGNAGIVEGRVLPLEGMDIEQSRGGGQAVVDDRLARELLDDIAFQGKEAGRQVKPVFVLFLHPGDLYQRGHGVYRRTRSVIDGLA